VANPAVAILRTTAPRRVLIGARPVLCPAAICIVRARIVRIGALDAIFTSVSVGNRAKVLQTRAVPARLIEPTRNNCTLIEGLFQFDKFRVSQLDSAVTSDFHIGNVETHVSPPFK